MASTAINRSALACLLLQHISSTFGSAAYDFASFLFLIQVFPDTLIPASLAGLCSTACGLILSGYIGSLVDRVKRLPFVRTVICAQKVLQALSYSLFLILLGPFKSFAASAFHGDESISRVAATWGILLSINTSSALLGLSATGMSVAIERDWITEIAQSNSNVLTRLNTYMRRIDLLSKLTAPLLVSLLTSTGGYPLATTVLLGMSAASLATEYWWVQVVYNHFPVLDRETAQSSHDEEELGLLEEDNDAGDSIAQDTESSNGTGGIWKRLEMEKQSWLEFIGLPIFFSSTSMALIHLTTLSYDGTFISYIKAARGWDDTIIASMRGLCLVTGLIGTAVMPILERRIGLERAGAWSIWYEVACLAPVAVSFFIGTGKYGEHGPAWNSIVLFGGIALSRIGLWSFDLCQLKELQLALDTHPRRNQLTARQISLQNLFDLLKYVLTLSASTPARFKWTALVSWLAIVVGAVSYAVYLRSVRGHLFHFCGTKEL
nr:solute carrier family 40 (iron-regulated transporter), member 1 [Kwoniella mangroviensis CBS 8507]OCF66662.1 solute carrier family 40 (iron-regulated transporter), member 1 [Kwoniella mangroviensis CBS 8507]